MLTNFNLILQVCKRLFGQSQNSRYHGEKPTETRLNTNMCQAHHFKRLLCLGLRQPKDWDFYWCFKLKNTKP